MWSRQTQKKHPENSSMTQRPMPTRASSCTSRKKIATVVRSSHTISTGHTLRDWYSLEANPLSMHRVGVHTFN